MLQKLTYQQRAHCTHNHFQVLQNDQNNPGLPHDRNPWGSDDPVALLQGTIFNNCSSPFLSTVKHKTSSSQVVDRKRSKILEKCESHFPTVIMLATRLCHTVLHIQAMYSQLLTVELYKFNNTSPSSAYRSLNNRITISNFQKQDISW